MPVGEHLFDIANLGAHLFQLNPFLCACFSPSHFLHWFCSPLTIFALKFVLLFWPTSYLFFLRLLSRWLIDLSFLRNLAFIGECLKPLCLDIHDKRVKTLRAPLGEHLFEFGPNVLHFFARLWILIISSHNYIVKYLKFEKQSFFFGTDMLSELWSEASRRGLKSAAMGQVVH